MVGPKHPQACKFSRKECGIDSPFQNSAGSSVFHTPALSRETGEPCQQRGASSRTCSGDRPVSGLTGRWPGCATRICWGVDMRSRESKPPCVWLRHPPTLLTEGHAFHILSKRKMCPFPRWISAHLCPKTVPHAFSLYVDMTVLSQPSAGCVLFSQCGEPFPHSLIFLVRTEPLHGWSGLGMLL